MSFDGSDPPLPAGFVLEDDGAPTAAPAAAQPAPTTAADMNPFGGIHFKDASQLAEFRKDYPDKAGMTDPEFLDWFGRSRTTPMQVTVGQSAPADSGAGAGQNADAPPLPDGFVEESDQPRTAGDLLGMGARGVATGVGKVLDIVGGPVNALVNALPGEQGLSTSPFTDLANEGADALELATPASDSEQLNNALIEGGTGGAAMAGVGGVMSALPGATGAIGSALAATPVADIASGAGSMGASELARQEGGGPLAQLGAAIVGGGLSAAGVMGASRAGGLRMANRAPTDTAQAFARQKVTMLPGMTGRAGAEMATGVTHMTLGGVPLSEAATKSIASAQAAKERIAGQIGAVVSGDTAGISAQKGTSNWLQSTSGRASKLYDAIPIAGEKPSVLSDTKQALSEMNAGLESNSELSALMSDPRLNAYEAALTGKTENVPTGLLDASGNPMTRPITKGGALSWQDLKAFRTYVGEKAGAPALQSDISKDALKNLYGALSRDMEATAAADGPKSLAAFQRANNFWRARQGRIDNVLSQILGKDLQKGGQAAFNQIESWARNRGDAIKLGQALRSMSPDEAASVRATVFDHLGMASPGRQDATGEVWSANEFMTHWSKMSDRAKSALFPGIDYRSNIDDLVHIASSMKDASKYANTSKTSLGTNALALLGAFFTNPIYAVGMGGVEFGAGKLMASPRFAKWLASAPKKPNGPAALAHINRLTAIAAAEPTIANNVLALQQRLASAFTEQPVAVRAAASPEDPSSKEENQDVR